MNADGKRFLPTCRDFFVKGFLVKTTGSIK